MEEKSLSKPTMVSRLPKFGARPSSGVSSPLPNGPPQPPPPTQEGKTPPPGRANGLLRTYSFSLKWRKDGVGTSPEDGACLEGREDKPQFQLPLLGKEGKKASPSTPKLQRSASSVSSTSSPKAIPRHQPSKASPKTGARLGQSPLSGGLKAGLNGSLGSRRSGSGSCLVNSGSPRSGSRDSLSQSSDSLKSLVLDNMVRSQSFTHFKQIPSPSSLPMTRSFSFNRAVELAKPLANTQLRTPRTTLIKPPQGLANGRLGLGLGGMGGVGSVGSLGGLQYGRVGSSPLLSTPTPTPPSGLKKPLLPSCVLSKPSALGCRLARPGQAKLQKPLFPGMVRGEVRAGAGGVGDPPDKADSPPVSPDPPSASERSGSLSGSLRDALSQPCTADGLEDMSLSSASSLERNDTSDEFLDDFDGLGDPGQGEVPDNRSRGNATEIRLRHFLNETMDWEGMGLTGGQEEGGERGSRGGLSSEEGEFPQGSSLELSPSNSSGGTYMWDEEGLGGLASHPCDSYDNADLNSMDILNQLGSLDPGDLEEDDLMLDVDLPDDALPAHR
ncbi:serine-rich coiled-coil domain-containing protein 2-like [Osmerus mordax]|uniref:serine-rich coiled-coil domain-containing protein 2-like n=1 Tax=Osmerus mordax TaxID=8014 RepID=UPI003510AAE6